MCFGKCAVQHYYGCTHKSYNSYYDCSVANLLIRNDIVKFLGKVLAALRCGSKLLHKSCSYSRQSKIPFLCSFTQKWCLLYTPRRRGGHPLGLFVCGGRGLRLLIYGDSGLRLLVCVVTRPAPPRPRRAQSSPPSATGTASASSSGTGATSASSFAAGRALRLLVCGGHGLRLLVCDHVNLSRSISSVHNIGIIAKLSQNAQFYL